MQSAAQGRSIPSKFHTEFAPIHHPWRPLVTAFIVTRSKWRDEMIKRSFSHSFRNWSAIGLFITIQHCKAPEQF
jgi:hypothetical protein